MSREQYSGQANPTERDYLQRSQQWSEQNKRNRSQQSEKQSASGRHPMRGVILALFLLSLPTAAVCRDMFPDWIQKGMDTVASLRGIEKLDVDYKSADEEESEDKNEAAVSQPLSAADAEEPVAVAQPLADHQEWTSQSPIDMSRVSEPIPDETARRLERLGVETGRLQRWGSSSGCWRYICRVRPEAEASVTHEFEAFGSSAQEALSVAEAKILEWRQRRMARLQTEYSPGLGQVCAR